MKKIKYIIVTIVLFFITSPTIQAKVICDRADILRVKNDANKVTVEYEFNGTDDFLTAGTFNLKIKGITEDMSIVESINNRRYTINSVVDDVATIYNIEEQNITLKIYYYRCSSELVRTIKIKLPKYNFYSEDESCEGISKEELEVCDPWYQGELDDETFGQKIEEYKKILEEKEELERKENTIFKKIIKFLLNYYLYIIATIVLVITVTIVLILRKKRYTLD